MLLKIYHTCVYHKPKNAVMFIMFTLCKHATFVLLALTKKAVKTGANVFAGIWPKTKTLEWRPILILWKVKRSHWLIQFILRGKWISITNFMPILPKVFCSKPQTSTSWWSLTNIFNIFHCISYFGSKLKVRGSLESSKHILWTQKPNFTAAHPIVVEMIH